MPRLYCPLALETGALIGLPPEAARHAQVLRLQPGNALTLFGALGVSGVAAEAAGPLENAEFDATVQSMGRAEVQVLVGQRYAVSREAAFPVRIALGVPAGERMDWLVEKATELGAAGIQPLLTQRSLLRLDPERARKKARHWQAVAVAACEQCGRNRVPQVYPLMDLAHWLASPALRGHPGLRWLLAPGAPAGSLEQAARALRGPSAPSVWALSGPEGGLAAQEQEAARQAGFADIGLGPRILRAETAPLALLAALALADLTLVDLTLVDPTLGA